MNDIYGTSTNFPWHEMSAVEIQAQKDKEYFDRLFLDVSLSLMEKYPQLSEEEIVEKAGKLTELMVVRRNRYHKHQDDLVLLSNQ